MRNPIRITCALSAAILVATGAGGCVEEDSGTPSYASAESKSELAGFIREIGDELNEFWGDDWGEGWKPAKIRVPKRAADTACGTIDADETGPAYCGDDRTMVLPARFFRDEIIDHPEESERDPEPFLVHPEKYRLKTMYKEDAVMELELSERPFVLYKSARRGCLTIIYRRKDGEYGAIDIAAEAT